MYREKSDSIFTKFLSTGPFLALLLLMSGCGENNVGAASCEADRDCRTPLICMGGLCGDPSLDTGIPLDTGPDGSEVGPEGCVTLTPSEMFFESIPFGEESSQSAILSNCGTQTLEIEDVFLTNDIFFHGLNIDELGPGEEVEFFIYFFPFEFGVDFFDELIVITNAGTEQISLYGESVDFCFEVEEVLDFGEVEIGDAAYRTVHLENCGPSVLSILAFIEWPFGHSPAFEFINRDDFRVLEPGDEKEITIVFEPEFPNSYEVPLLFLAGELENEINRTWLVAEGVETEEPCLSLSESVVDFGVIPFGQERVQNVELHNCGSIPVSFDRPILDGDENDFIAAPSPGILEPNQTASLYFGASGERSGNHAAVWRLLSENENVEPVVVSLFAEVEGGGSSCLRVADPLINFGDQPVGNVASNEAVLENCGDTTLRFLETRLEGPGRSAFGVGDPSDYVLDPGEQTRFALTFAPTTAGSFRADLRVEMTDEETVVTLFGNGIEEDILCLDYPNEVNFGSIQANSTIEIPITNCGDDPVSFNDGQINGDIEAFNLDTTLDTIFPGETRFVEVQAIAEFLGSHRATYLQFIEDEEAIRIDLLSNVLEPDESCLTFSESSLSFEPAIVGSPEVSQQTTLINCGETSLTVEGTFFPFRPDIRFSMPTHSLDPGEETNVEISFTPNTIGNQSTRLDIEDSLMGVEAQLEIEASTLPALEVCFEPISENIDFGIIEVGERRSREISYINCGETLITVLSAIVNGDVFEVNAPETFVGPGEEYTLSSTFVPQNAGVFNASLMVQINDDFSIEPVILHGIAEMPLVACLELDPTSLDFGELDLNSDTVVLRSASLENCGTADLNISHDFFGDSGFQTRISDPFTLDPGESSRVEVSYSAGSEGRKTSTLQFSTTGPDGRPVLAELALRAMVVDNSIRCMEPVLPLVDFGTAEPGEALIEDISFRNCGDTALNFQTGSLTGDDEFQAINGPSIGSALQPGGTHTFRIMFQADREGDYDAFGIARYSSDIETSARMVARVIDLEPILRVSPLRHNFGRLDDGTLTQKQINVCNVGGGSLSFDFELESDTNGLSASASITTLAADTCTDLTISYRASAPINEEDAWENTLHVASAYGNAQVLLSGVAVGPTGHSCLELTPTNGTFGPVLPDETVNTTLSIRNCGNVPLQMEDIRANEEFISIGPFTPPPGDTLEPGRSGSVRVRMVEDVPGTYRGNVNVTTDLEEAEASLQLTVREGNQCLDWSPGEVRMGPIEPNRTATQDIRLNNCGDLPIEIAEIDLIPVPDLDFRITQGSIGELDPDETLVITLEFSPTSEMQERTELIIISDYDEQPEIFIPVQVIAEENIVCEEPRLRAALVYAGPYRSNTVGQVDEALFLDAGFSEYSGEAVWELAEGPTGAHDNFESTSMIGRVRYIPSEIGEYVFEMHYDSDDCGSGVEEMTVEVREGRINGLRVVISWRTPGDPTPLEDPGPDIDLHVVRREIGGRTEWNTNNDCYFSNCHTNYGGLNWGDPNYAGDDARLLRDEVEGVGPEIMVVDDPEEDVEYIVGIHYWSDDGMGHSDITLRIFIDGIQREFAFETVNSSGDVWLAASIREAGEVVEILDLDVFPYWPPENLP